MSFFFIVGISKCDVFSEAPQVLILIFFCQIIYRRTLTRQLRVDQRTGVNQRDSFIEPSPRQVFLFFTVISVCCSVHLACLLLLYFSSYFAEPKPRRSCVRRPPPCEMSETSFHCFSCATPLEARMWGSIKLRRIEVSTPHGWILVKQAGKNGHFL